MFASVPRSTVREAGFKNLCSPGEPAMEFDEATGHAMALPWVLNPCLAATAHFSVVFEKQRETVREYDLKCYQFFLECLVAGRQVRI